jgi:uncharacterized protein YndB with AHSA1/START domain
VIDVIHEISATQRRVGSRTLAAGEARTVTITRQYRAPVEDVWDAVTNAERIPRWFLPISGDLRVGGRYQLEGNAGGTIERCDPPLSFAATWEFGGEVSWIELRLSAAVEGGTRLELEHIAHVGDARWAEFGPGAVGVGWDLALTGFSQHIETGEKVDAAAAMAWAASDEGRQYITASSQRWCEASIAFGTDPAAAQAAAERTTAFYTGGTPSA